MKKSGFRVLIGLVVIAVIVILVYQNSGKNTAQSGIAALQAIVETGEYTVAVTDESGEKHELEDSSKTMLAELISSTVADAAGEDLSAVLQNPQFLVEITGGDPAATVGVTVYDAGEETDFGMISFADKTYPVKNCGEVLNYLAEIGFATAR
ncbi:hypothetical protein [Anaerotignum sp.]|uniref:hypothetical protein n=1 Tax=Anaerotignum sp. TaxID=2039241 RepID=UPI003736833A